ncbi:MAG: sugar ABC transporter permease [Chloroflexota bacterium]|nr:sugar ABC transporter permease [Chloroflexota bacterium]
MADHAQVRAGRGSTAVPARTWVRLRLGQSPWPFILPAVLYLLVFSIYPLVSSFLLSLQEYSFQNRSFAWVGLDNYAGLLRDAEFRTAFRNTAVLTVSNVLVELALGMGLALFMHRDMVGKGLIRSLLILPMVTTPMVVGLMWRFLLNTDFGPVNYLLRLAFGLAPINWLGSSPWSLISLIIVDVWQWTPFAFLVLYAGLQAIPHELREAARIDGAGPVSEFKHVVLPLLMPLVSIVVLFRSIDSWRSFDTVFSLTFGGPGRESATLSFVAYLQGFAYSHLGLASAMSYVMVVVVIVFVTAWRAAFGQRMIRP